MSTHPNILMITVDQQRYDCIGFSNHYPVQTPNIDKLASEGIWFTNAYSHLPVCGPSRQSLVNGRRPEAIGSLWNFNNGLKIAALEPSEYSWARELKRLDYQSGYIGKWGVHPNYDPTKYGYDEYVDENHYREFVKDNYPNIKYSNSYFGETNPIPVEHSKTHWTAGQATSMIQEMALSGRPWHIRVNFSEPHLPCRPSRPFSEMYPPSDIPKWGSFEEQFTNKPYIQKQQLVNWQIENFTWNDWAPIVARYYGIISQMDDAIGQILATLEQLSLSANTVVIFTSDHGDLCGGHRMMDKHYVLYDDVVKVPFIMKWPTMIAENQICDQFVYNFLDLPPTILDLLDIDTPDFFVGSSLMHLVENKETEEWRKEIVSTYNGQQFGLYTQRMIRNRDWKYIWNTTDIDELYDLNNDPHELKNRIDDISLQSVLSELRNKLYRQLYKEGDGLVRNDWLKAQLLKGRKLT